MIRALRGEEVARPPVWLMRQAGRYLPEYRALREKYSFRECLRSPELACAITMQPIERINPDAAIIFSDILVIPDAMGCEVSIVGDKGPVLGRTVRSAADVGQLHEPIVLDELRYVLDAIRVTKEALDDKLPLIGFAGAPWTILCYMVEGKGSKDWSAARAFLWQEPEAARRLLEMLTRITIDYLRAQVEAGVNVVQIFDSWAGALTTEMYERWALPYIRDIVSALSPLVPTIVFAKGVSASIEHLAATGASALSLDWSTGVVDARRRVGMNVTLQGNLDPAILLTSPSIIRAQTIRMLDQLGVQRTVANLGHGLLPTTPVEHVQLFVDIVKEYVGE